ncbi:MAG TPA: choice-of-anchor Q domain-containing protein [Vicinamibacterales bacterium]|nr:choice-of-anchor Q domain-containing protein [Vicinamibacterales bacterium]
MEANRALGEDRPTIDLTAVPGNVITLGILPSGPDDETSGDLNVTRGLSLVGAGALSTVIDANGAVLHSRAVRVEAGEVTILGLTIRNGQATSYDLGYTEGGGVYAGPGSNLTLSDCRIHSSVALSGGGLHAYIAVVRVEDSEISGNAAQIGGGLSNVGGSVTIRRSLVDGNRAERGGGLYEGGGGFLTSSMVIIDSAVVRNRVECPTYSCGGGGLKIEGTGGLTLENVTISGNTADLGGGIFRSLDAFEAPVAQPIRIFNSTITDNRAAGQIKASGRGGGVYHTAPAPDRFTFENTILAGNLGTLFDGLGFITVPDECEGTLTSNGGNLMKTNPLDCTVLGQVMFADPGLGALAHNGGPTPTHALIPESPAIDSGAPGGCRNRSGELLTADQRGAVRPFGSACDIGAFESNECTYALGSTAVYVPNHGSTGSVPLVVNDARCSWTVKSNVSWIVVTPGVGSSGSGMIGYIAAASPAGARRGEITVADQRFLVMQGFEGSRADFDGDRRSEIAIYRPASGSWYYLESVTGFTAGTARIWGAPLDIPVWGDYDGDGRTDVTVYRPSTGHWFVLQSSTAYGARATYQWGTTGDMPVPGDYDGDGTTDVAIYRPSTGMWYVLFSASGFTAGAGYGWGAGQDIPIPGDYDGDGRADLAVYRPSTSHWFIRLSSSAYTVWTTYQFGGEDDDPVPADYDGDGCTDIGIYRRSTGDWFTLESAAGFTGGRWRAWGGWGDLPVPADYDGDGRADIAVYRPSTGHWFILESGTGFSTWLTYQWGTAGDVSILARER